MERYNHILNYLLKVLNYNEYKQYPDESDQETNFITPFESYIIGGKLNKNHGYDKISKDNERDKDVDIAIIPKWFEKILINPKEDGKDVHEVFIPIAPFYISTKLRADNTLDIERADIQWATCLDEPSKIDGVSFKIFEIKTKLNKTSWEEFIKSVKQIYHERYHTPWDQNYILDTKGNEHPIKTNVGDGNPCYWIMREDAVIGTKKHIKEMLTYLKENDADINSLLKVMLGDKPTSVSDEEPAVGKNISKHIGQMKNEYPLADAQRHALHCMASLTNGNVLAVSGPPGTGKTTMLQSVVADMIVKSVLKNDKIEPPTILATSANNKAITNIIDAFEIEGENNVAQLLFTRWIKYNDKPLPLAIYFPSSNAKNKEKFFCSNSDGGIDYSKLRNSWKDSKSSFLKLANKNGFSNANGVSGVKELLRQELLSTYSLIKFIENSVKATDNKGHLNFLRRILWFFKTGTTSITDYIDKTIIEYTYFNKTDRKKAAKAEQRIKGFFDSKEEQSLKEYVDKALDMSLRFKCFWLAVHYYEGCWLEKIEANTRNNLRKKTRDEIYKEMSLVCPCMVATFFRAPLCFRRKNDDEGDYHFNFADLLIVDEAGQACTEIGLPTFALAKKAIVVGDEKQIPPIYSVKSNTSQSYWNDSVGSIDDELFKMLDCSNSSVMRVASHQSAYNRIEENEIMEGLFLNEHRRCYNDIIAYCNKLIYRNMLKPLGGNPKPGESVMPVIAHFHVNHSESEKPKEGSRKSEEEANAIISWIKKNESVILDEYKGDKIEDIISIITPFTLQAKEIRTKLSHEKYKIQCGTVHTFQGAESPIVIYSTVYGSTETFSFVDNNEELMNVAVSRAKKHFFLFCSKTTKELTKDEIAKIRSTEKPFDMLLKMASKELKQDYISSKKMDTAEKSVVDSFHVIEEPVMVEQPHSEVKQEEQE